MYSTLLVMYLTIPSNTVRITGGQLKKIFEMIDSSMASFIAHGEQKLDQLKADMYKFDIGLFRDLMRQICQNLIKIISVCGRREFIDRIFGK